MHYVTCEVVQVVQCDGYVLFESKGTHLTEPRKEKLVDQASLLIHYYYTYLVRDSPSYVCISGLA